MDTLLVALIVAAALFYVGRRLYRTASAARRRGDGCGTDCGCSPEP